MKRIINLLLVVPFFIYAQNNLFESYNQKIIEKNYGLEMIPIPEGEFQMGSPYSERNRMADEGPIHKVKIEAFWMAKYETTWDLYHLFMERKIDKKQPKFDSKNEVNIDVDGISGATTPYVEMSFGMGIDGYPAISMTQLGAKKFCQWLSSMTGNFYRLPTEAEYEYAMRSGNSNTTYTWGNQSIDTGVQKANVWQGDFPSNNMVLDDFYYTSPVKSFGDNDFGLYDISGNVWEWCSDLYHSDYYSTISNKVANNPKGPTKSFDPNDPFSSKRVMRGGSFLCNDSYCSGFRNSMRMKSTPDSSSQHVGFRTVLDL